jgi:excisionase family DNA binding protein
MIAEIEIISTKEAAKLLGCRPVTVRKALDNGRLKGKKIGRDWVVYVDETFSRFTKKSRESGRKMNGGQQISLPDLKQRMEEALKLAEELDPIIEAGTLEPVDAVADVLALRNERVI